MLHYITNKLETHRRRAWNHIRARHFRLPQETSRGIAFLPLLLWAGAGAFVFFATGAAADAAAKVISFITYFLTLLATFFMVTTGLLLDTVIELTVRQNILAQMDAIKVGWVIARDLSNLFFIFILLAIGIATILGL